MAYCGIEFYNDNDKENNGEIAIVHLKWTFLRAYSS